MPHQKPFNDDHTEAIRVAIAEGLRVIHALAGRQRVPPNIRRSLDRLEELEGKIDAPRSFVPPANRGWLAKLISIAYRRSS